MSRRPESLAWLALFLLILSPGLLSAQERIHEGTWTGMVVPPGEEIVEVEYRVSYGEAGLEIELVPPPDLAPPLPATEILHDGEVLSFTLEVDATLTVSCALYRQDDGRYEGECIDPSGEAALMTMFPPAESASAA